MSGIVVVRFDERGEQTFYVFGDDVRLIIVDDRCPHDRVYECLGRDDPAELKALLRDDPIGNINDDRHKAVENRVARALVGKPHLEVVKS